MYVIRLHSEKTLEDNDYSCTHEAGRYKSFTQYFIENGVHCVENMRGISRISALFALYLLALCKKFHFSILKQAPVVARKFVVNHWILFLIFGGCCAVMQLLF